jgi:hypothetical protein
LPGIAEGDDGALTPNILSVQSSKGLEFSSVIFIGLGQIESSETQAAQNMKLLYKACPA